MLFTRKNRVLLDPAPGDGNGNDDSGVNKAAIEKARLEERQRAADQLATLRQQVESLTTANTALKAEKEKAVNDLGALQTAYEALKAGIKQDGTVNVESAIETAVNAALSRQGPALQQELETLRGELAQERKLRETAERERARARAIEEAGGATVLIPELVTGNTPDEIAASIESSKRIFANVLKKAGVAPSGGNPPTASGSGNSAPSTVPLGNTVPAGGGTGAGGSAPLLPGGRISMQEYAKNREALKAQAIARAQGK